MPKFALRYPFFIIMLSLMVLLVVGVVNVVSSKLGLSSIVELSQAQLQQTEAEITNTNAQYQHRLTLAVLNFQTGVQP
jgi:hypothetical protein